MAKPDTSSVKKTTYLLIDQAPDYDYGNPYFITTSHNIVYWRIYKSTERGWKFVGSNVPSNDKWALMQKNNYWDFDDWKNEKHDGPGPGPSYKEITKEDAFIKLL